MVYDVIFIVMEFINKIGVDILSLDFGMKVFLDFELHHCLFLLLLKWFCSFHILLVPQ